MNALIALSVLGAIALFAEVFRFKKLLFPIAIFGLVIAGLLVYTGRNTPLDAMFCNMVKFDKFALLFMLVLIITAIPWFISSRGYLEGNHKTDFYALALFALIGAVAMVTYWNLSMLFLGVEILSLPVYVLAGSRKEDWRANESALKYFLMGAFASAILLFGIALVYGATGSLYLDRIAATVTSGTTAMPKLFYAGAMLMLAGLAFKVSAAPFHFWTPDVYQGAPTHITAFMATIVKTAAFAAFFRLFSVCFSSFDQWKNIVLALAALTLCVGNITAVFQSGIKRMLAYSSISHVGFMLMAILSINVPTATSSIIYYSLAYSVASITAFTVLNVVTDQKEGNDNFDSFNGIARNNPLLAFVMTVAMFSMAGIPPTAGFFAKYYIFVGLLSTPYKWLALLALLMTLVGVYYYFRVIIAMYFKESTNSESLSLRIDLKLLLLATTIITILLGFLPDLVLRWI